MKNLFLVASMILSSQVSFAADPGVAVSCRAATNAGDVVQVDLCTNDPFDGTKTKITTCRKPYTAGVVTVVKVIPVANDYPTIQTATFKANEVKIYLSEESFSLTSKKAGEIDIFQDIRFEFATTADNKINLDVAGITNNFKNIGCKFSPLN